MPAGASAAVPIDAPRLTGALRAVRAADGMAASATKMFVLLKQMEEQRAQMHRDSRRSRKDDDIDDEEEETQWQRIVLLQQFNRDLHRQLISRARRVLGDELSSDAFQSATLAIVRVLCGPNAADEKTARDQLLPLCGQLEQRDFEDLRAVVAEVARTLSSVAFNERHPKPKEFGANLIILDGLQHIEAFQREATEARNLFGESLFPTPGVRSSSSVAGHGKGKASTESIAMDASPASTSVLVDVNKLPIDRFFIRNVLQQVVVPNLGPDAGSVEDLAVAVFNLLRSPRSEIESDLVDMLGYGSVDVIEIMLSGRTKIVAAVSDVLHSISHLAGSERKTGDSIKEPRVPPHGAQVIIQTESEKYFSKKKRKEKQKYLAGSSDVDQGDHSAVATALGFDAVNLLEARRKQLEESANAPLFSSDRVTAPAVVYPNVYSSAPASQINWNGVKLILPVGTTRRNEKDWEEVIIPITKPAAKMDHEELVEISRFDEFARPAFNGYKALNRLQSLVFNVAYNTNENMLVCAPTGAGKTDVAMMTILHEMKQHVVRGGYDRSLFKIIYVAPMKALAAEVVRKFSSRLRYLGITVAELTGDMQMTKSEIQATQIIVTTPEKWDVVTRKNTGDVGLAQQVRLLIIDEVHLLHDDRGPVIETLIARTLRQVESTQAMIRIVGLSATLPNFIDVARFLRVNPMIGLFFFDNSFRPVPLAQQFVGVKSRSISYQAQVMNTICFNKIVERLREGHQVMVFVHSRKDTVKTAQILRDMASKEALSALFKGDDDTSPRWLSAQAQVQKSKNQELRELYTSGFGFHNAGMLRADRNLVEKLFSDGFIRVMCCTATLAWGVNLPAHTVIIKGTQLYNAEKGGFMDLSILDVLQIFGRAGRPQFDTSGEGIIITTHDKLTHYLNQITSQTPIESQFIKMLTDNLNAEIALGTVTNINEAVEWMSYTYLHVRMKNNPLYYGLSFDDLRNDPGLHNKRRELVHMCAQQLDKARMVRYNEQTGSLSSSDLGRVASHFYIRYLTIEQFNEHFAQHMTEADLLALVSQSSEFENIKLRDEEIPELDRLLNGQTMISVKGGVENPYGKVNILLQTYISRGNIDDFSLVSDSAYVAQNASRIFRALFEMAVRKSWVTVTTRLLDLCKMIERRQWSNEHPLAQLPLIDYEIIDKLTRSNTNLDAMRDMDANEIGQLIHHQRMGKAVKTYARQFPALHLEATVQPITRSVLRVQLSITPDFEWNERIHGTVEPWWIWVEDAENEYFYHTEYFLLHKKQRTETQTLVFNIPIFEPLPPQYYVRAVSDRWLGAETAIALSFKHLILPDRHPPASKGEVPTYTTDRARWQHTELLDLQPLPKSALQDEKLESLYKFSHFNTIQTQIFHTLYHTDHNVLLGAPTGSGKTIAAEIAMWRAFRVDPTCKVVYIAPLKALVRERVVEWSGNLVRVTGKKLVELTGDVTPDLRTIQKSDIIITTPEKWDAVSRSWKSRAYIKTVALVIIDEIHLLGQDRGPTLEVIVSRMTYISAHTDRKIRVVGLSTALANARDVADWLRIKEVGLYNFRPSVRPVPLEVIISGFSGKHYCPRMATMNKPVFSAIREHSPDKPVIVFVSSRRQTRLTAQDLISLCAMEENPRQFLSMDERSLEEALDQARDSNLKFSLGFGIGLHHAGLVESDRKLVEDLFVNRKIQVLIATSTLAWGVNTPTHLVVIKGTEFYDAKTHRYVDMPITDVLQMMGRAGRPQYDTSGIAVICVQEEKKNFYKKFLYEPFPVESSLHMFLHNHLNAEIAGGTITSKQDVMDYLSWTYYFRRLMVNPSYYNVADVTPEGINAHLSLLIETTLDDLQKSLCVEIEQDKFTVRTTSLGLVASYYYLSHETVGKFYRSLEREMTEQTVHELMCDAKEYDELPVRHNEDTLNAELSESLPWKVDLYECWSPHVKTNLLLQAHFARIPLPISDYYTDLKSVLDQAVRVLQAMIDIAAEKGLLSTCLKIMTLVQCLKQARWPTDNPLVTLPGLETTMPGINQLPVLPELVAMREDDIMHALLRIVSRESARAAAAVVAQMPITTISFAFECVDDTVVNDGIGRVGKLGLDPTQPMVVQVRPDTKYEVVVELKRRSQRHTELTRRHGHRAHAPRFPKPQEENWWLVCADMGADEIKALKRVTLLDTSTVSLAITTPFQSEQPYRFALLLISDVYMGLDQQLDFTMVTSTSA